MTPQGKLPAPETGAPVQDICDQMRSPQCVEPQLFLPDEWRALDSRTRKRILDHVAGCPVCQAERAMAEAFEDAPEIERAAGASVSWPTAMAAGLALALGLSLWVGDRSSQLPAIPEAPQTGTTRGGSMTLSGRVQPDTPAFEWSAVPGAKEYRLIATDLTGRMIWTQTTTSLGLSPDLSGWEGTISWRWSVEALGPDGTILAASSAIDARTPQSLSNE